MWHGPPLDSSLFSLVQMRMGHGSLAAIATELPTEEKRQ
jgi:hypothetical protein